MEHRSDDLDIPDIGQVLSYAADFWMDDIAALTDEPRLRAALNEAAKAGGAIILGELFHIFPNGAVTGILLLAQSHLSIHTWPELALATVDLLGYGDLQGDRILHLLETELKPRRVNRSCVLRAIS